MKSYKHYYILFFLLFNTLINAQSFKYRKYNYEWPVISPNPIKLDSIYKNEDAVILEEKCIYNEGGTRVPEYTYLNIAANYVFYDRSVQGVNPIVKKYMRIKFLTQKGIEKFSRIVLPESFDPASDYYNVRPQWRSNVLRPLGEFECIIYFAARVIKPDGTIKNANVKESTREEIINGAVIKRTFYNWIFQLTDLQAGDEVEIDYSYEGVYNYGKSNRVFFNSDLPIQKLDLTFRYPEKDFFILSYHNGAFPKDSTMVTLSSPHYTEYYFHFENLHGGINEPGGRPYKELPYFSFYKHNMAYGIPDPKTQFIKIPLPYPWSYVMLPTAGYKMENLKLHLSKLDNTTIALNKLTEKEKQEAGDTASAFVISTLQEDLAENYKFQEDPGYNLGEAPDIEHLGKNIDNKTLRQMSRLRLYDEVMRRLDKPYYHSLLIDKRISELDINRYESTIASRLSIAVPYKNYILQFYPKSYRFGYEPNELPFYYEDISSILTPQSEISSKKYELVPQIEYKFIRTPPSDQSNNTRNTACKVTVSLDSSLVYVQAKIRLSGQFSTLTRGFYKYGSIDTTVNPSYYTVIALSADDSSKIKTNISSVEKKFPFAATINQDFTANNHLTKIGEKEYELNLKNWFNNITEDNFHSEKRFLDYYPDFQSQDIHRFLLHFDHPVSILNTADFKKAINNSFTDYVINVSTPTENDILLESSYIVKTNSIPASNTNDVETVFNSIHLLNNTMLKIRKTN